MEDKKRMGTPTIPTAQNLYAGNDNNICANNQCGNIYMNCTIYYKVDTILLQEIESLKLELSKIYALIEKSNSQK